MKGIFLFLERISLITAINNFYVAHWAHHLLRYQLSAIDERIGDHY